MALVAAVIGAAWGAGCGAAHERLAADVTGTTTAPAAGGPTPTPTATPAPPPQPQAPPGPGEWQTWSRAQKLAYMKSTVLPAEQKVFAEWEPNRFRVLACDDCHGTKAVADGTFRMPNPDLPKLCGGPECFKELAEREHDVLKFMQQKVVNETARLLGVPAFDMEKHVGFSCYQCHTRTEGRGS
jgi:hypothetical protein